MKVPSAACGTRREGLDAPPLVCRDLSENILGNFSLARIDGFFTFNGQGLREIGFRQLVLAREIVARPGHIIEFGLFGRRFRRISEKLGRLGEILFLQLGKAAIVTARRSVQAFGFGAQVAACPVTTTLAAREILGMWLCERYRGEQEQRCCSRR